MGTNVTQVRLGASWPRYVLGIAVHIRAFLLAETTDALCRSCASKSRCYCTISLRFPSWETYDDHVSGVSTS